MHDSDELDDILNEIRNRQNPHTEDTPPEPEPPQTVDMPLFDHADAPTPAPKDLPENPTLPTEAAEETPTAPRYAGGTTHRRRQRRCIYQLYFPARRRPGQRQPTRPRPDPLVTMNIRRKK